MEMRNLIARGLWNLLVISMSSSDGGSDAMALCPIAEFLFN